MLYSVPKILIKIIERQYVHAISNATTATTFTNTTTAATSTRPSTSIAAGCKSRRIKMKNTKVYKYIVCQKDISAMS